jgi:hypothetical protein
LALVAERFWATPEENAERPDKTLRPTDRRSSRPGESLLLGPPMPATALAAKVSDIRRGPFVVWATALPSAALGDRPPVATVPPEKVIL